MGKRAQSRTVSTAARSVGETILEMLALGFVAVAAAGAVLWWTSGADGSGFWDSTVLAGKGVLDELGWVIGVCVPTLLGFYVLVLGEQLSEVTDAGRLRRVLGAVAEASFAALIPGLLLVVAYCLSGANVGPLFVILPAIGLLLFLTVQLGAFVVFDTSVQLDEALNAHARSRARLYALRQRSRRPTWLVIVVNLAVIVVVVCASVSAAGAWSWLTEPVIYTFAAIGAVAACLLGAFVAVLLAQGTALSRVGAVAVIVVMWLTVVGIVQDLEQPLYTPLTVAVLAMAFVVTLSAIWPLRRSAHVLADWTLAGTFAAVIARREAKAYRDTSKEISRLRVVLAESDDTRPHRRLSAAWAALRASGASVR